MEQRFLEHFLSLTRIPRPSHHEEAVSRFLYQWALAKGLHACRDEAGNVIIDKSASPGREGAPRTILQGHMDMVCVAEEGRSYDPLTDPIRAVREGNVLTADGTSLGGDDGAGVAVAMDILVDDSAVHGPLRAVFTVDEEDGMTGAVTLDARHLDAKYLINLDWEAYGSLCCSSAGSDMYAFRHAADWTGAEGMSFYALTVQGMEGGHSGAQIHLGRANAIRTAAAVLAAGAEKAGEARLCAFRGGSAHNAIPSSASAVVAVPADGAEAFLAAAAGEIDRRLEACALTDPGAVISLVKADAAPRALSAAATGEILGLLMAVHDGVNTWSAAIPGLVESSANTGLAALAEDGFSFTVHQRSSQPEITARMKEEYLAQAALHGFAMEVLSSSPAWPVRPHSELVALCCACYKRLEGSEMRVEPIHAGLECGAFSMKNPALDIISIGPDLRDIHSPKEALSLSSAVKCELLVREILKEIAEK